MNEVKMMIKTPLMTQGLFYNLILELFKLTQFDGQG